eukprot:GHVT01033811.1.p1 GENE.GHVT01033811.1~~GHVT01033811.1.p1  ORF type:complete len:514 (+),score=106.32 GHVT01033811.1:1507-3048(+)
MSSYLSYFGSNFFRQRLAFSTLSGRPIKISKIGIERQKEKGGGGIRKHEASLLRLLDKISDGCSISVDPSGTVVTYTPGLLTGGAGDFPLVHFCGLERSVVYFLEFLLLLAPFAKRPLDIKLRGLTADHKDISIDTFRTVTLATLLKCLKQPDTSSSLPIGFSSSSLDASASSCMDGLRLDVLSRGNLPLGGGEVHFVCPLLRRLLPFTLLTPGKVKRIRGVAYTCKMPKTAALRAVDSTRFILNQLLPDVWIYTDNPKQDKAGKSPGYGLSLVAETMKGCFLGTDFTVHEGVVGKIKDTLEGRPLLNQDHGGVEAALTSRATGATPITRLLGLAGLTDSSSSSSSSSGMVEPDDSSSDFEEMDKSKEEFAEEEEAMVSSCGHLPENVSSDDKARASSTSCSSSLTEGEWVGRLATSRLLIETSMGGVTDSTHQYLPLFLMALADDYQRSSVRLSRLTPYTIQFIRHLYDFFQVKFSFAESSVENSSESSLECSTVIVKAVGVGFHNLNRKTF